MSPDEARKDRAEDTLPCPADWHVIAYRRWDPQISDRRRGARYPRTARKARQRRWRAALAVVADDRMAGGACGHAGRRHRRHPARPDTKMARPRSDQHDGRLRQCRRRGGEGHCPADVGLSFGRIRAANQNAPKIIGLMPTRQIFASRTRQCQQQTARCPLSGRSHGRTPGGGASEQSYNSREPGYSPRSSTNRPQRHPRLNPTAVRDPIRKFAVTSYGTWALWPKRTLTEWPTHAMANWRLGMEATWSS
jgi:hypothetical protein